MQLTYRIDQTALDPVIQGCYLADPQSPGDYVLDLDPERADELAGIAWIRTQPQVAIQYHKVAQVPDEVEVPDGVDPQVAIADATTYADRWVMNVSTPSASVPGFTVTGADWGELAASIAQQLGALAQ